jgi:hypothetical protein
MSAGICGGGNLVNRYLREGAAARDSGGWGETSQKKCVLLSWSKAQLSSDAVSRE